jgi:hypothetical protein
MVVAQSISTGPGNAMAFGDAPQDLPEDGDYPNMVGVALGSGKKPMRRRKFISLLGGGEVVWSLAACQREGVQSVTGFSRARYAMHERLADALSNPAARDSAGPVRNLLIMHSTVRQDISDWVEVIRRIEVRARDIEVRVATNGKPNSAIERWQVSRPSLVFSPFELRVYQPRGGTVYSGRRLNKLDQIERLNRQGVPVPLSSKLTPDLALDPARWGDYAVIKPLDGGKGQDVYLVQTGKVAARYAELTQNGTRDMLIQPYIEHTENGYPTEYRVMTLFGKVIYSARNSWAMPRTATLEEIANDPKGIIASNSRHCGRARTVWSDAEIISLGEKAHAAFPDIPVLGVDVVRDAESKRLFVMEVNPTGDTWHLSSYLKTDPLPEQHRRDLYAQFGALDRVAQLLIEKTRAEASYNRI